MGVHGDGGLSEGVSEHDVGGLAPHARQGHELLAAARHPPLEALGEGLSDAEQMAGLGALEAQGPQDRLEVLAPGGSQGGGVGVALEELGGDRVDARVSGLGRQDGGHEQLEGAVVVQGAGGVGVEGHELVVDGARAPGRLSRQRRLSNLGSGPDLPRRLGPSGLATRCPTHCVLSPRSHRRRRQHHRHHQCRPHRRGPPASPGPPLSGSFSANRHCSRSRRRPASSRLGPCRTTHPMLLTPL